jgi:hypothetical protein
MKPKILLRVAALLTLLHTIGHTLAAFTWHDAPNNAVKQVIDGMLTVHFDFTGRQVSMGGFYAGFGYTLTGVLLMITMILWMLSNDTVSVLSKQVRVVLAVFLLFSGVIEYCYIIAPPAAMSFLAGICVLISLRAEKRTT